MARKKPTVDLEQLASEVAETLHGLALAGYQREVTKIRQLLQAQGETQIATNKVNRDINNALTKRLSAAEKALRQAGVHLPDDDS